MSYEILIQKQKAFFNTGQTRDINFRIENLKRLYQAIIDFEDEIESALFDDVG